MAKQKKTLEQKKKSDMRKHTFSSSQNPTGLIAPHTFSLSEYAFTPKNSQAQISSKSPMTLTHGLEKSLLVSSVIVILQLAIFFLFTHHILILPGNLIQY